MLQNKQTKITWLYVKSVYQKKKKQKIFWFFISQPKHMLRVLKLTVSLRRFFWAPKKYVKPDGLENIYNYMFKMLFI